MAFRPLEADVSEASAPVTPTEGASEIGSRGAKIVLIADTLSAVPIWAVTPFVRPWHMRWGATKAEVAAPMPGDDIVRRAQFNATRAITMNAPPEDVWRGSHRSAIAGPASTATTSSTNAGERFQTDEWMLWVHRPHENEQPDSTWSWQLRRLAGGRTRVITRMKQDYRWQTPRLAMFNLILMEFGDFAMERSVHAPGSEYDEDTVTAGDPARRRPDATPTTAPSPTSSASSRHKASSSAPAGETRRPLPRRR
jgi:hypothetical protein